MAEREYEFSNKQELLAKLRAYSETPDDDNIRYKQIIKEQLLECPELLYALHNKELESELFDENGNLNTDGEWDRYFGESSSIRPFLIFPETQTEVKTYVCYQVHFDSAPTANPNEKYCIVTFTVFVNSGDSIDRETGIARHDLISSIIRERFNWSNIFSSQSKLISNKESTTDTNYLVRTLAFRLTTTNSLVKTTNGRTRIINKDVKR